MKKLIEIDDTLFERLEKIQKDYHINSLTPVISLVLTLGVNWFKKLEALVPQVYTPPQWDYWWGPYTSGSATVDENGKVSIVSHDDKWNIMQTITGQIDNAEE